MYNMYRIIYVTITNLFRHIADLTQLYVLVCLYEYRHITKKSSNNYI